MARVRGAGPCGCLSRLSFHCPPAPPTHPKTALPPLQQVKGCPAVFKGFATHEEAVAFMRQHGAAAEVAVLRAVPAGPLRPDGAEAGGSAGKRVRDMDREGSRTCSAPQMQAHGAVSCDFSDTQVEPYPSGDPARTQLHSLWFDGGSRGNGGASAVAGSGTVIYRGDSKVWEGGRYLGCTTNNVAEYTGLLHGLEVARVLGVSRLEVRGDSKLVILQVQGGPPRASEAAAAHGHLECQGMLGEMHVPARAHGAHALRCFNDSRPASHVSRGPPPAACAAPLFICSSRPVEVRKTASASTLCPRPRYEV
jgi:hypothetical protein